MTSFISSKVGAVLAYSLCSSTMLLVNKVAMIDIPYPAAVSNVQFIFALVVVLILKALSWIKVDEFEWSKVKPFFWYVTSFTGSIYCNMKALGESNVETVIVFRSCSPVIVALLDWLFLGRELPNCRSLASLLAIIAGSAAYVMSDKAFSMNGWMAYTWVIAYLALLCFNMSYGKHIMDEVKMVDPIWGSVLYINALSIIPTFIIGAAGGEDPVAFLTVYQWDSYKVTVVLVSCIIGTAISWTGFNCRKALTATGYTLVGVLNKLLTVLFNVLWFDDHASAFGIAALVFTILGGTFYRQAPLRKSYTPVPTQDPSEKPNKSSKQAPNKESPQSDSGGAESDVEMGNMVSTRKDPATTKSSTGRTSL